MGVMFHIYSYGNLKTDVYKILELAKIFLTCQGEKYYLGI